MTRIIVIPDSQCKPGVPLEHLRWAGNYIAEKKPEVIVNIGDHFDFPSMSRYTKGKKEHEGQRLVNDFEAGAAGLETLVKPIEALQESQKNNKKKVYSPRMVYTMGNHEYRVDRYISENPELEGMLPSVKETIEAYGFEVYDFLRPVSIDGILFVHYMSNPYSGNPYGGSALNVLQKAGRSFVCGHRQGLDVATRYTPDGTQQWGIIAGSYYQHDEDYKGPQGNHHWRGILVLNDVKDGSFDPCFVSLDYLRKNYDY